MQHTDTSCLGAQLQSDQRASFRVWAPFQKELKLVLEGEEYPLERDQEGYFWTEVEGVEAGARYVYQFGDGVQRADPVSRRLPQGPFGPTEIVDPSFAWSDGEWKGVELSQLIFYECHVGTFTQEGTFHALMEKLPYLQSLGITCLELMPLAQFSGRWNWGYDGVSPYAVQNSYGTPAELKELVDRCHALGIAVCLDVSYNHFGAEGCFLQEFGPYFTDKYQTPWGRAVNYDDASNGGVRQFMIENALYWITEYHIDVLRLDALHALYDASREPFLRQLARAVKERGEHLGRRVYLVGEDERNDSHLLRGKWALDAWWNEDFHHALHVALTHEHRGYYQDYRGIEDFKEVLTKGVLYQGRYSNFRKQMHGSSYEGIERERFVVFLQNHDQVGNRAFGDRLLAQLTFPELKMNALPLFLTPSLPLIFMGQEYGEEAPFLFFFDYADPALSEKVKSARLQQFGGKSLSSEEAFLGSKLHWDVEEPHRKGRLALYQKLIEVRRAFPFKGASMRVYGEEKWVGWEVESEGKWLGVLCLFEGGRVVLPFEGTPILHTEETQFMGEEEPLFERGSVKSGAPCGILYTK